MDGDQGSNQPSKPPPKKGVFKGKRAKPKFSRNARKGSDLKGGISRQRYRVAVVAAEARGDPPASPTGWIVASATSRAAISSPTKQEFKAAIRRHVKELQRVTALNESQLKKNSSLKRKLQEKEATVKVATRQNTLQKAALKKAEKDKTRVEAALHREMSFRVEDADRAQAKAAAAEAAFEKERLEFQTALKSQQQQFELYLKEAVSEAKVCL